MTNEEKRLLFKVLCGMLPYGVMVENVLNHEVFDLSKYLHCLPAALENFKPYLRPMSSMTEEEKREVRELGVSDDGAFHNDVYDVGTSMEEAFTAISWFLERHFDINYLIQRGLALEAPEGMYK